MIYFLITILIIWILAFIGCLITWIMLKVGKWNEKQLNQITTANNVFWYIAFWVVAPFILIFKGIKNDKTK